jgi:hypothetical protein
VDAFPWETPPGIRKPQKKVTAAAKSSIRFFSAFRRKNEAPSQGQPHPIRYHSVILPNGDLLLLFIVQTVMRDMISEREDGTVRRMLTTRCARRAHGAGFSAPGS